MTLNRQRELLVPVCFSIKWGNMRICFIEFGKIQDYNTVQCNKNVLSAYFVLGTVPAPVNLHVRANRQETSK